MTYENSLSYLKSIELNSYIPNHDNSVNLMKYLSDIQNDLPVIHVAGTNGKGSTISFLRDIYIEAGYSVGTFMSPHIFHYKELVEDNRELITDEAFANATSVVKDACDRMVVDGLNHPTVFECLIAIAIVHFSTANHDIIIIEVGLGGQDDATNIFLQPLLSIITPISYDHEAILGNSIEQIAKHKAGIVKKGTQLLLAPNPIEAISTITNHVSELNGHMYLMDEGLIHSQVLVKSKTNKIFNLKTPYFEYKNLHTKMFGRHQEINLAMALLAVDKLKKKFPCDKEHIYNGIKKTTWTCRNELISIEPLVLIDGAHNQAGAKALHELIKSHYKSHKIITLFGVLEDKTYLPMVETISEFSDEIIFTRPESTRSLDPSQLSSPVPHTIEADLEKALGLCLNKIEPGTMLLVTGSLYLTYPAKVWLTDHLSL